MSVRSFGRSNTQTLSSLSTASPVTPPIFHLFGSGLGQVGIELELGRGLLLRWERPEQEETADAGHHGEGPDPGAFGDVHESSVRRIIRLLRAE